MRNTLLLVVVLLLLSVVLSGCTQVVDASFLRRATDLCSPHDGVRAIIVDRPINSYVYCVNGVMFRVQ
jgi:hypothetical protein